MIRRKNLKKKYLFIALLLLVIGNGGFIYPGNSKDDVESLLDLDEHIPLFVLKETEGYFEKYSMNPYYALKLRKMIIPDKNYAMIMHKGLSSISDMMSFLLHHNPELDSQRAANIASYYFNEARDEGVNHDVAFSQMCLETGFLSFRGVVSPNQNNFCGLGAVNSKIRGERFANPELGVRAHIQHLKAYASHENIRKEIIDERYGFVKRGTARTVQELTGKWASDELYDKKILNLMQRLYDFSAGKEFNRI